MSGSKRCNRCGEEKPLNGFSKDKYRSDGLRQSCRSCCAEYLSEYRKRPEAIERARQLAQARRADPEQAAWMKSYMLAYRQTPEYKARKKELRSTESARKAEAAYRARDDVKARFARYKAARRLDPAAVDADRETRRRCKARARATSPRFRLDNAMSCGVNGALKGAKAGRSWEALVGYSLSDLMEHLERQFVDGMTWDNYGRGGWHVDHIVPKSWFDYESPDDSGFMQAWALTNLQPLSEQDNVRKGNRFIGGARGSA